MKIALYSNDIALILRWENSLNKYKTQIIEDYEELCTLKDSVLILSDCVNLENSDFVISVLLKNSNKILESHDLIVEISGGSPTQSTGRPSDFILCVMSWFLNFAIISWFNFRGTPSKVVLNCKSS